MGQRAGGGSRRRGNTRRNTSSLLRQHPATQRRKVGAHAQHACLNDTCMHVQCTRHCCVRAGTTRACMQVEHACMGVSARMPAHGGPWWQARGYTWGTGAGPCDSMHAQGVCTREFRLPGHNTRPHSTHAHAHTHNSKPAPVHALSLNLTPHRDGSVTVKLLNPHAGLTRTHRDTTAHFHLHTSTLPHSNTQA
jgi:hypothetical protein